MGICKPGRSVVSAGDVRAHPDLRFSAVRLAGWRLCFCRSSC